MKKLIEYANMVRDVVYYAYGGVGIVLITALAAMIVSVWNGVDGFNGATTPAEVELIVAGIFISNIVAFLSILVSQYKMKDVVLKSVFGCAQLISLSAAVVVSIVHIENIIPSSYIISPSNMSVLETTSSYLGLGILGIMVVVLVDYAVYIIELFEKRKSNE